MTNDILAKLDEIDRRLYAIEDLLLKRKRKPKPKPMVPVLEIVDLWNNTPGLKPTMVHVDGHGTRTVPDTLRKRITSCWAEHSTVEWFSQLFTRVAMSDFLTGRTGHFVASLYWAIGPENRGKILLGEYDNRATAPHGNGRGRPSLQELLV